MTTDITKIDRPTLRHMIEVAQDKRNDLARSVCFSLTSVRERSPLDLVPQVVWPRLDEFEAADAELQVLFGELQRRWDEQGSEVPS